MIKKYIFILLAVSFFITIQSCKKDYLNQKSNTVIFEDDAYASISGINTVAANLYAGMLYQQDFSTDQEGYDLSRFDEVYNNSSYGFADGYAGGSYRSYYPYFQIRKINLHIQNLNKYNAPSVSVTDKKYFLAEARFLRAMVYFIMGSRMGGVPLVTDVYEYPDGDPQKLAKARNKEYEIYDFIASEVDAIANDLDVKSKDGYAKNRATKGAALALKCRAMLYAGTLAKNETVNRAKNLVLASGAVGIPVSMANGYFEKCLDAFNEIKKLGYTLYNKDASKTTNFSNVFLKKDAENPETIFVKDYDGTGITTYNPFTMNAIPRSMRSVATNGAQFNPTLNLAEKFELISSKTKAPYRTNTGAEVIEEMDQSTSSLTYEVYSNISDIFAGRDNRLFGSIIIPGSTFRGNPVKLQAGVAEWTGSGYKFWTAPTIEVAATSTFNGLQRTGEDGPHLSSFYCSHSGFLIRKFLDPVSGSEVAGKSNVPYVIFRYGEMLLNAAEAAFQLGKTTEALDYVNQIRERAAGTAFRIGAAELTMDRIMNERTVELAFEDHRFNDLKRWRIADEVWNGSTSNPQAVLYALWPYKIYRPNHADNGKFLYRRLRLRGTKLSNYKEPIRFSLAMYYPSFPSTAAGNNPLLEPNPNH